MITKTHNAAQTVDLKLTVRPLFAIWVLPLLLSFS